MRVNTLLLDIGNACIHRSVIREHELVDRFTDIEIRREISGIVLILILYILNSCLTLIIESIKMVRIVVDGAHISLLTGL